jgi:hypothetical protein
MLDSGFLHTRFTGDGVVRRIWATCYGNLLTHPHTHTLTQLAHSPTVGLDAGHLQQAVSRHLDSHDYTAGHGLPTGHPQ